MRDQVFERELEVGLELLRDTSLQHPSQQNPSHQNPSGGAPPRRSPGVPGAPTGFQLGNVLLLAAGLTVVGATLWLVGRPPANAPPEVVAQDPLGEAQIQTWIAQLSGPDWHGAGANLVLHGGHTVPHLAQALAQEGSAAHRILQVLGCCAANAPAAMEATLSGFRSRHLKLDHAVSMTWALAQLSLHTDNHLSGVERQFRSWYSRPLGPDVRHDFQRMFMRRDVAQAGLSRQRLPASLARFVAGGSMNAGGITAEQLAHPGMDSKPALEELIEAVDQLTRHLGTQDWDHATWNAADPTVPAAPPPGANPTPGGTSRWSPWRDANGRLHFVLAQASHDVSAMPARRADGYRALMHAATAALRAAPDHPRTLQSRIILASASARVSDRVWHLSELLKGDPTTLRTLLPHLAPLVRDPTDQVAQHAADVVAVALADAQPGAQEASTIEQWALEATGARAKATLTRLATRLQK